MGGYQIGDKGQVVMEINFRLAGFGGLLPTEEFTELTEKGVKQFQRDYMKMDKPTGVADFETLDAIDEFSAKYRENIDDYKCPCGECGGFGKGQFINEYRGAKVERLHKYEYPGMHQSLLWAVSAARFYLTKKLNGVYSVNKISAGYRCWIDNTNKGRNSTNHMGKAVDILFNKNGVRTRNTKEMDELREKIFCDFIGAAKNLKDGKCKFDWATKDSFSLESSDTGADTWVHIDVREFSSDLYLLNKFFISAISKANFSKNLSETNN